MRIKRGILHARKRKKLQNLTKGYMWGRKKLTKRMKEAVMKAGSYAYAHRKMKKRDFRALWNIRINAAARANGTTYRDLIHRLKLSNIVLDRKILAKLGAEHPEVFKKVVEQAKIASPTAKA